MGMLSQADMFECFISRTCECQLRQVSDVTQRLPAVRGGIIAAGHTIAEQLEETVRRFSLGRTLDQHCIEERRFFSGRYLCECLSEAAVCLGVEPNQSTSDGL